VKKLYVGNLPFQATEQNVADWFAQAGVSGPSVTLIRDQMSGQLRGFGFVEVANNEEADRAIQALNGQDFMGRKVVVNEARRREGGGGRGNRGGGDRGGRGY
jgi:RNA recognition motif-containing protein